MPAFPALLLDVTAEAAREGSKRARALKPDPFFTPTTHRSSPPAASTTISARLLDVDWIIEAIVERLDIKRSCSSG